MKETGKQRIRDLVWNEPPLSLLLTNLLDKLKEAPRGHILVVSALVYKWGSILMILTLIKATILALLTRKIGQLTASSLLWLKD